MSKMRDWSIDRKAIKALVAVYGPREAARQAGISPFTVLSWCRRYKWKKADRIIRSTGVNGALAGTAKDAADSITAAMARHKEEATVDLAHYTARAARDAAKHEEPLEIARKVRDVAQVYRTLYPPEEGGEIIEGAILVGRAVVKDNPVEMLEATTGEVDEEEAR
jgi:Putative ATPase subunit of terminase (gpP-like)